MCAAVAAVVEIEGLADRRQRLRARAASCERGRGVARLVSVDDPSGILDSRERRNRWWVEE